MCPPDHAYPPVRLVITTCEKSLRPKQRSGGRLGPGGMGYLRRRQREV